MRRRIVGLTGGKRRRGILFGALASVAAVGALLVSNALAVHDENFQLDGDVSASTTTNFGGHTQSFDWDSFFNAAGEKSPVLPDPSRPGFDASSFDQDFNTNANGSFNTSDSSTFATGSKDTLAITPGWQCNQDANVNSKIDIMNAYATSYSAGGQEFLYFALERNANTGTADVGFWFLQDDNVNCQSPGGNTAFNGDHVDGDLLVVSEFTSGGTVSTIQVYRWDGGANGSLNPTPVINNPGGGADCRTAPLTGVGDRACGRTNTGTITTPWLTSNKQDGVGHSLRISEFYEGGINLTESGLGGKCFNTFIADTRSSTSLTATLFDFSRGQLGDCTSTTETTPVQSDGTTPIPAGGLDIPADPADASLQVKDQAVITVTGASPFEGNVTFHLCGPFATGTTTVCGTGGVLVSDEDITTNGTYTSDAATVTSAGRYCWRADFTSTTDGVPDSSDSRSTECFKVNPRKPTLTTEAGAGPVDFGQPVTDTATLTGTAHKPGTGGPTGSNGSINPTTLGGDATGTITFTLFKQNADGTCGAQATGTGTNPQTVTTVSGDGTYGPVSFTPDAPGTYVWVASYGGDPPNTLASDASACNDANEDVVVRTIPTEIKTKQSWFPNDTATVTSTIGNLAGGGSVVFSLHNNATCSGGALYSETKAITGGSPSQEVSTSNGNDRPGDVAGPVDFAITTGYADPANSLTGQYSWKVVYTPAAADTAHTGKQSACDAEHFNTTYTNDPGPGTNLP